MRLYFLRHGLADWPEWDPARDHVRPLTKEGLKKMKEQAKTLLALDLKLDAILSSPYTRAYQTADIVAAKLRLDVKTEPRLAPGVAAASSPRCSASFNQSSPRPQLSHASLD